MGEAEPHSATLARIDADEEMWVNDELLFAEQSGMIPCSRENLRAMYRAYVLPGRLADGVVLQDSGTRSVPSACKVHTPQGTLVATHPDCWLPSSELPDVYGTTLGLARILEFRMPVLLTVRLPKLSQYIAINKVSRRVSVGLARHISHRNHDWWCGSGAVT